MIDKTLVDKIRELKIRNSYTLHDLSKLMDVQVSTLERWLKTNRINRLYAEKMREKLGIKTE